MTRKVGKYIGGNVYLHKSVPLNETQNKLVTNALEKVNEKFIYHIIKINEKKSEVSFIQCDTFDILPEPIVGDSIKVNLETGQVSYRKKRITNHQIYHHRWMMVEDSYTGFDIEESKLRSKQWLGSDIEYDPKKIGNSDYWNEVVLSKLRGETNV